jgi:hypothetical protein
MQRMIMQLLAAAGAFAAQAALAHPGHGLEGAHWHATDAHGFVLVGVLAAVAIWLSRSK